MTRTVYRQAHTFPPGADAYASAIERRRRSFGTDLLDRAGSGLSVVANLETARTHARAFQRLGHILVRYNLPDDANITIEHLVGADYHLTL